jgi:succinyl-CoA synthetase alpha subunit/citrate synthase
MTKMKNKDIFPYFVGIKNLKDLATKDDKVVVINILGSESRKVTPVSHSFSGGNVVAGVQYGTTGVLETEKGDIPVYPRLADVVKHHQFNTGVVYLPPTAVFYAVNELLRYKRYGEIDLQKIVLVTEKISVKDQRMIRAICQREKVDVFGANALGIADSWNHIRIGGALGGDAPQDTLIKGSVAIHSNSGNFGNTIAEYMKTEGFGTTAIMSSGKDIIIQFAAAEFLNAAHNDKRTKAAVLYVEPGGFYEKQALDWIQEGKFDFDKPMVVCVTGRWKSKINRAVGHAGALAGSNDDAESKEKWFDDYFGIEGFDPEFPDRVSKKGVRVTSIQHIPVALKAIYKLLKQKPDFKPKGNLSLKPWMGNDMGMHLPPKLSLATVKAIAPFDEEIAKNQKQLGAVFMRQSMRNKSSASRINRKTQIAELYKYPVINLIDKSVEQNMIFALTKVHPHKNDLGILNTCLNYLGRVDDKVKQAVAYAEQNETTPNQTVMVVAAMLGNSNDFKMAKEYTHALIDLLVELGIKDVEHGLDIKKSAKIAAKFIPLGKTKPNDFCKYLSNKIKAQHSVATIMGSAAHFLDKHKVERPDIFLISAVFLQFAFSSMVLKRISRQRVEDMYAYLKVEMQMLRSMAIKPEKSKLLSEIEKLKKPEILSTSVTEVAYEVVFAEKATEEYLKEFNTLISLTLTNGAGTISAKGAKESVSARNNISTTYAGFLANTGLAHGGSGYEAVEFLLDSFKETKLKSPEKVPDNLKEIATKVAIEYKEYKENAKRNDAANIRRIPCINHPVFKGKRVNIDPREDFIYKRFKQEGIENVFWDYYHELVKALYDNGVSSNVYCVNIDAVIAVISLKLMWKSLQKGNISDKEVQKIGFIIFLIGRMIGVSAEIADHMERGNDMDCRTPLSELDFVL